MSIISLSLPGAYIYAPKVFADSRGKFFEWFQFDVLKNELGNKFDVAQANCSVSEKNVIRGIHLALTPPGQAKFVTCFSGSVFDVLIDLRRNSDTFMKWESVILDSRDPKAIYIPSGFGHAFMSLEPNTTFVYLCDQKYNPKNEITINPFDKEISIEWPTSSSVILSERDKVAPDLPEVFHLLPN